MIEVILMAIILILCGLLAWHEREARLERAKLINALISKNAQEMVNLDLADKTQIKAETPQLQKSDLIPIENLEQEVFEKAIKE